MNKLATVVFENLLAHLFFKVYRSFNCDPHYWEQPCEKYVKSM